MSHPIFARHETFHPRYGWLKKGVELIDRKPSAFADDDVHLELGVGKNMAHAIRYWCEAFGLIQTTPALRATPPLQERRSEESLPMQRGSARRARGFHTGGYSLTTTARDLIAGPHALDPYIESPATLWWLHYNLIKTQKATTWDFVINHFGRPSFTAEQLLADLRRFVETRYPDHKVAESSLVKDVNLFLRMYSYDEKAPFHEDSIDSPFVELGLLHKRGEMYSFATGAKPTLPDAIIVAAVLDYGARRTEVGAQHDVALRADYASAARQGDNGPKSISFSELMTADGSPVKAFRLSENDLYDALERTLSDPPSPSGRGGQGVRDELFLSDTAGVKQLSWKSHPQKLVHKLLRGYYRHALH